MPATKARNLRRLTLATPPETTPAAERRDVSVDTLSRRAVSGHPSPTIAGSPFVSVELYDQATEFYVWLAAENFNECYGGSLEGVEAAGFAIADLDTAEALGHALVAACAKAREAGYPAVLEQNRKREAERA